MIKLSDEMIEQRIKFLDDLGKPYGIPEEHKRSIELGIKEARDYYDAQIDNQAKTMDELWELSGKCDKNIKAIEWYIQNNKNPAQWEGDEFAMYVAFFLAAGGTIKE